MQLGIYKCGGQIYKLQWEMYECGWKCNHVLCTESIVLVVIRWLDAHKEHYKLLNCL